MCHGVHSATYDKNGDVIVVTCTNTFCDFHDVLPNRRKEQLPIDKERRKV
jgi:hypothetical protein